MRTKTGRLCHNQGQDSRTRRGGSVRLFQARWMAPVIVLAALAALGPSLDAKKPQPAPTKNISGAVLDPSNNGISGASVMLTDLETHKTDAMYSGVNGVYAFSGLNPNHDYEIQAKYQNVASKVRQVSSLDSRMEIVVNLVVGSPRTAASHTSQ